MKHSFPLFFILLFCALAACNNSADTERSNSIIDTTTNKKQTTTVLNCDSAGLDRQPVKNYKQALAVWLETTSLDWFLQYRRSVWANATAWNKRIFPIDSNALIQCEGKNKPGVFLYIPNNFYVVSKNGDEFFRFFIVNNSSDTLKMPCLDATIDYIGSSISFNNNNSIQEWIPFQKRDGIIECGNSRWTMNLPPKTVIESEIDSYYVGLGDTTVNYRIELLLGDRTISSNPIPISLMKKQLPYLRKEVGRPETQ